MDQKLLMLGLLVLQALVGLEGLPLILPPLWIRPVPPQSIKLQVSQAGLNYATKQTVEIIGQKVKGQRIPDIQRSSGRKTYSVTNMKVTGFNPGTGGASVGQGTVTLSVSNVGASVHGNWRYQYKWWFIRIRDSGSFDLTVSGATIRLTIALGIDSLQSGRPTIRAVGCYSSINSVRIKFGGTWLSWLYNFFSGYVERPVKSALTEKICKAAKEAINENAAKELKTFKVKMPLGNRLELDYRLAKAPYMGNGIVEFSHRGETLWRGGSPGIYFVANSANNPRTHTRMLSICLSSFVMNTLGKVLHNRGVLKYSFTSQQLPSIYSSLLKTSCSTSNCFGNLLPTAIQEKYKGLSLVLDVGTTVSPTLKITTQGLHGNMTGHMNISVLMNSRTKILLFSTLISTDISLKVQMINRKVTASVINFVTRASVVESSVGAIEGPLNFLFDLAIRVFIKPKLNEVGHQGLELPSIDYVNYVNPQLVFSQNTVCFLTDVQYRPWHSYWLPGNGRIFPFS